MDPTTTLTNILETLHLGDTDEAVLHLAILKDWLFAGGFAPNVPAALDAAGIKCRDCVPYANVPAHV